MSKDGSNIDVLVLLTVAVTAVCTVLLFTSSVIASRRQRYAASQWLFFVGTATLLICLIASTVATFELIMAIMKALATGDRALIRK